MPASDRLPDPTKFDASRLMMPRGPGKALMEALERTRNEAALSTLESKAVGMDGTRIAALSGLKVGAGAAMMRALTQSQRARGIGAVARATTADSSISRKGRSGPTNAAISLRQLNLVPTGPRPVGVSTLTRSMPGMRIPQLSDAMPKAPVRPVLDMSGTTKAIDRLEAMHLPGGSWESQTEILEAVERRLAWGRPAGPQGQTIDWLPSPPDEQLSAELSGLRQAATEAGEAIAADRRAQVKRDEEMVRAMQAMEVALVESAEREAVSLKRAEAAEAREIAAEQREIRAQAHSEELNTHLVKLTVVLVILTCISVIAGMVAVMQH